MSTGNLIHLFWLWPLLNAFWVEVFTAISDVTGRKIDLNPLSALFEVLAEQPPLTRSRGNYDYYWLKGNFTKMENTSTHLGICFTLLNWGLECHYSDPLSNLQKPGNHYKCWLTNELPFYPR